MTPFNQLRTALALTVAAWALSGHAWAAPLEQALDAPLRTEIAQNAPQPPQGADQVDLQEGDPEEDAPQLPQGQGPEFFDDEDEALSPADIEALTRQQGGQ